MGSWGKPSYATLMHLPRPGLGAETVPDGAQHRLLIFLATHPAPLILMPASLGTYRAADTPKEARLCLGCTSTWDTQPGCLLLTHRPDSLPSFAVPLPSALLLLNTAMSLGLLPCWWPHTHLPKGGVEEKRVGTSVFFQKGEQTSQTLTQRQGVVVRG